VELASYDNRQAMGIDNDIGEAAGYPLGEIEDKNDEPV
jgi:hypothetical protein